MLFYMYAFQDLFWNVQIKELNIISFWCYDYVGNKESTFCM